MNTKTRIASILNSNSLDSSITGLQTFHLSQLKTDKEIDFPLPTNLRLGHLAEKIVAELIKASSNYSLLYENIQLIEDKKTIGEIDFILEKTDTKKLVHMELAYKFYLFDPSISSQEINNWIGPNRNDSLAQKLVKLKDKQFPLLHHHITQSAFSDLNTSLITPKLCLLASLYIPHNYKGIFTLEYQKGIKGYYLSFETFIGIANEKCHYYLPPKKEWGMNPSEKESWYSFNEIEMQVKASMEEKQTVLCWQKGKGVYEEFFVVWW